MTKSWCQTFELIQLYIFPVENIWLLKKRWIWHLIYYILYYFYLHSQNDDENSIFKILLKYLNVYIKWRYVIWVFFFFSMPARVAQVVKIETVRVGWSVTMRLQIWIQLHLVAWVCDLPYSIITLLRWSRRIFGVKVKYQK